VRSGIREEQVFGAEPGEEEAQSPEGVGAGGFRFAVQGGRVGVDVGSRDLPGGEDAAGVQEDQEAAKIACVAFPGPRAHRPAVQEFPDEGFKRVF